MVHIKKTEKAKIEKKKKSQPVTIEQKSSELLPSYKIDRQNTIITSNSIQEQEVQK